MNMQTVDETNFRTLFGFSVQAANEYSGIFNRLKESLNLKTKISETQTSKKTNHKDSFKLTSEQRTKRSIGDSSILYNKKFREDVIESQRLNRFRELHKDSILLTTHSRGPYNYLSSRTNLNSNMSLQTESEYSYQDNDPVFGESILLPKNSMFKDLDEMTEMNLIEESKFRTLFKKIKKVYDSLSDEELLDTEINETFYIDPFSKLRINYDLVLFVFVFYSMFSIPYQLAFYINKPSLSVFNFLINFIIDVVFICDIALSFVTAYYDFEEKLVKPYHLIAKNYFRTWFIVDVLSALPLNSILILVEMKCSQCVYTKAMNTFFISDMNIMYSLLKMLRLLKAIKVFSVNSFIDKQTSSVKQTVHFVKTVRLLTTLLIFSMLMHLCACLVIFVGYNSYPNWIASLNLNPKDKFTIYIASLYFICTTVLSIGYGDILTYNITERLINGLLLTVGLLLYSWTVSTLTSYLMDDDEIIIEYRNKLLILDDIKLTYDNMPDELYSKIQRHLLYKVTTQKMDVNAIFNTLPIGLRNNLIIEMYRPIIDNFIFFKNHSSTDFIIQVILSFKPLLSLKGEKLLNDGDVLDEMIFVKKGKLTLEFPLPMVLNERSSMTRQNSLAGSKIQTNLSILPSTSFISPQTFNNGNTFLEYNNNINGTKQSFMFQSMVSMTKTYSFLKKSDTRHFELTDFDFNKQSQLKRRKHIKLVKKPTRRNKIMQQQYVKLIEIRQNEHFGDVLMFLTKRSPLRVRVKTKTAALFLLKKTDAVEISNSFPKIWKQIIKKSLFNMKQINRLINKNLKFFFIHYEGSRNLLGRSFISSHYNQNSIMYNCTNDNTQISNKRRYSLLAKMSLGKSIEYNKTHVSTMTTNNNNNNNTNYNHTKFPYDSNDIDTSNSELESIPDGSSDSDNNSNNNDKSDKHSMKQSEMGSNASDTSSSKFSAEQNKRKTKIKKMLESFEENTLKQTIHKIEKQTIIYKHYCDLLGVPNNNSSSDNDDNDNNKGKHLRRGSLFAHGNNNNHNIQSTPFSQVKITKISDNNNHSNSSSSGSSIVHDDNNNNNNKGNPNDSSSSSSSSSSLYNKSSNNTNFNSKRGSLQKSTVKRSSIAESYKSSVLLYKDLKLKHQNSNTLDELSQRPLSNIQLPNSTIRPSFNNTDNNTNLSDGRENVYSEFHSHEDELKDNLFITGPPLKNYDPFSNYDNIDFGINANFDIDNDASYGKLIKSFNKTTFNKRAPPTRMCSSLDTVGSSSNNNNNSGDTLNFGLTISKRKQSIRNKSAFRGGHLSTNNVVRDISHKSNNNQPEPSTFNTNNSNNNNNNNNNSNNSRYVVPNKPKCNFTFSSYNSNNNNNNDDNSSKVFQKNSISYKDKDSFGDSSFDSSDDTQKKIIAHTSKYLLSISPHKDSHIFNSRSSNIRTQKYVAIPSINNRSQQIKPVNTHTLIESYQISPTMESNLSRRKVSTKDITRLQSRKSKINASPILLVPNSPNIKPLRKRSSVLLNISSSSDDEPKGKDDLEVEKILGMGTMANLPSCKYAMYGQSGNSGNISSLPYLANLSLPDNFKKVFLKRKTSKRNSVLSKNEVNALERITSNIQENSSNLNEPKEFYANLFSQFLEEKNEENVGDNKGKKGLIKKFSTFKDAPMGINEENEDLEQTVLAEKDHYHIISRKSNKLTNYGVDRNINLMDIV